MFSARARRRVHALGASRRVRSSPIRRWLFDLIESSGLAPDPGKVLRVIATGLLASACGAVMMFGIAGGILAVPVSVGGAGVWLRRQKHARLTRIEDAFPGAVRAISDAVRAGLNVPQALVVASEETPAPLDRELYAITEELSIGVSMEAALGSFVERCPVPGADLFGVALVAASRSGADLPPVFDCIIDAARDRQRLRREMRVATAQGRLTAIVVGGLPAVFLLVMGAGAHEEIQFLFGEPIGWVLLGAGALLEIAGFAWINRMVKTS